MSVPFLRQARLAQSFAVARRFVSQCRRYSAPATRPRHEPEQDSASVAGPSRADASATTAPAVLKPHVDPEPYEPLTRIQKYLTLLNAAGMEPTLEDLEACKPAERPQPHSPQYVTAYNELVSSLCRSFTKEQLRKFLVQSLGTSRHCATNRKKADYAESILNQLWKWPTLSELEKAKRDRTEVVNQMIPMVSSELFLILGRDGVDLLRMSQDYDVHISLRQKPMALRIEGTRTAVKEVIEHITSTKKTFMEEKFDLPTPTPIPADMVPRISRIAQAYLENIESSPGKIRIFAKDADGIETAKRLASRAVHEIELDSRTPLLTHLPAGTAAHTAEPLVLYPHVYAFYPYLSPRALPFTMNTSGAFRLRRVGEWLKSGYQEDVESTGGLASEHGHILTANETPLKLKETLMSALPESVPGSNVVVKASLGHMLLTRISKDQRATLVPPLVGDHPFGKIRRWIADNPVKMSFVPGVPLPLLNTAPAEQKVIHRLVYHSISPEPSTRDPRTTLHRREVISFEATFLESTSAKSAAVDSEFARSDSDTSQDSEQESQQTQSGESLALIVSNARCSTGIQAELNLMMPDRPMDIQFSVTDVAEVSEGEEPPELTEYTRKLRAFLEGSPTQQEQPTPPFLIDYCEKWYLLGSNVSARQSIERVTASGLQPVHDLIDKSANATHALCESSLDLESNQRSMHCQVAYADVSSDNSWKLFLRDCDRLSVLTPKSNANMPLLDNGNSIL
ncbi:hypothetical protein C8Q80DRAFT_1129927 [Daedaleopsis nitida]|nr:hypothetical protein C8Q80DRAFT_1129927 [Daedaleopsis nitida]